MTQQSTPAFSEPSLEETRHEIARHWGWFLALGILLVLAGMAAIAFPFLSTIAAKIAIGWIFLVAGVVEVIHAFYVKRWAGFFWNLLIGLLYIVAGAWLAFFPLTGVLTLTIVIAALFIAEGIMEFIMGLRMRPHDGWGWVVFSARGRRRRLAHRAQPASVRGVGAWVARRHQPAVLRLELHLPRARRQARKRGRHRWRWVRAA